MALNIGEKYIIAISRHPPSVRSGALDFDGDPSGVRLLWGQSKSMAPIISCVIPVYNDRLHLPRAIKSALDQRSDVQVVLVDDCSTDGSGEFASRWHVKIGESLRFPYPLTVVRGLPATSVLPRRTLRMLPSSIRMMNMPQAGTTTLLRCYKPIRSLPQ